MFYFLLTVWSTIRWQSIPVVDRQQRAVPTPVPVVHRDAPTSPHWLWTLRKIQIHRKKRPSQCRRKKCRFMLATAPKVAHVHVRLVRAWKLACYRRVYAKPKIWMIIIHVTLVMVHRKRSFANYLILCHRAACHQNVWKHRPRQKHIPHWWQLQRPPAAFDRSIVYHRTQWNRWTTIAWIY